jgi:hypothetical protein
LNKLTLVNLQTLFTLHLDETYLICVPKQDYNHLFVVSTFLLFVIPMSIITILYILIGLQLRKSKIVQRGAVNGSSVRLKVNVFLIFIHVRQKFRRDDDGSNFMVLWLRKITISIKINNPWIFLTKRDVHSGRIERFFMM